MVPNTFALAVLVVLVLADAVLGEAFPVVVLEQPVTASAAAATRAAARLVVLVLLVT